MTAAAPAVTRSERLTGETDWRGLIFQGVLLLSLLFSRDSTDVGTKVVLLGGFALVAAPVPFCEPG